MGRKGNVEVQVAVAKARDSIRPGLRAEDIQNMDRSTLLNLQEKIGLGDQWGTLEFPINWLPAGGERARARRTLELRQLLALPPDSINEIDLAILTITRYALVCFFVPMVGARTGSVLLSPTTLTSSIRRVSSLARISLNASVDLLGYVFRRLDAEGARRVALDPKLAVEGNRLLQLTQRGFWHDAPLLDQGEPVSHPLKDGISQERQRGKPKPFLPFPDLFTSAVGWRCGWIVKEIDFALIRCLNEVAEILTISSQGSPTLHAAESKRSYAVQKFLAEFRWVNARGQLIESWPFNLNIRRRGSKADFVWPPRTLAELKAIASLSQMAHLMILLFCTGSRIGEGLSMNGEVIRTNANGALVDGRTFKLVFRDEGAAKDWPLPDLGVQALCNQREMLHTLSVLNLNQNQPTDDSPIHDGLWARVGTGKEITSDYNEMLLSAIERLGLKESLDGTRPHAHRFRKSIARLCALAVVGAPKILMDLFGHKAIEMTLHYILTDPLIRAEMEEVAKAQVIMMARTALDDVDNLGGPASTRVKEVVENEKARLGSEFGDDAMHRLADTFTLGGKFWQLVRPGVMCIKLPQQSGPCNKGRGSPEPSRCRSDCGHRLESAALRDDVDRVLNESVTHLERCRHEDDPIGAEMWVGQIIANINRFPDLQVKWTAHPVVNGVLAAERRS